MSQLWQLTAYEVRLCLKSKTFWIIGGLAILTIIVPSVSILLIQYMVVSTITRDQRSGFPEILASLHYNTAILFSARALAMFFLLMAMWPIIVIVVGVLLAAEPVDWLFNGSQFALLTLKYIVTCMTSIGCVFFASLATRHTWKLYLIIGIWWIIGVFFDSNLSYFPSWSKLFLFAHGVMLPKSPSVAVGYFLQQDLFLIFATFQIAVAILFLIITVARQMARRDEHFLQSKLLTSLVLVAITTASIASFIAWRGFEIRENDFRAALRETEESDVVFSQATSAAILEMEDYHLDIKLRTAVHYLEGTATLKIRLVDRPSDIVYFTLRNCFAVGDVIEGGRGERLEWWRDGSRLAVRVPARYRQGDSLILSIVYSGQVWEWFTGSSTRPDGPVNFVDTSLSLLRSGYAWYPIPGDHHLYTREYYAKPRMGLPDSTLWAKRALHPAVPFELTVDIDADSMVASNLEQTRVEVLTGEYKQRYWFSALQGRDVFLMTGPYHHEKRNFPGRKDFVEVYSYPQHQSKIDKVMNGLAAQYLFYEDMLKSENTDNFSVNPHGKTCTVMEIPSVFYWGGENTDTDLTLVNTVLINDWDFQHPLHWLTGILGVAEAQESDLEVAVLKCWGQDGTVSGYRDGNIADGLGLYLYTLYKEKTCGHAYYEQVRQKLLVEEGDEIGGIPSLFKGLVVRDVFMTLDTIRTSELGDPAIKRIMREMYQVYVHKNNIDGVDFAKTVEAVLSGKNWPQEKSDEVHRRLESITQHINNSDNQKMERRLSIFLGAFY